VKRPSLNEVEEAIEDSNMPFNPKPPLSNEQLAALREAAQKKGAPLDDSEREIVLYGRVLTKTASGIPVNVPRQ